MASEPLESIYNFLPYPDGTLTAGQPTADQLAAVKEAGYEVVINLLPAESEAVLPNERDIVQALGMEYVSIPVIWQEPKPEDLAQFFAAMEANAEKRVFVHCAANMRVSAFMYLYRTLRQQIPPEDAQQDLHRIWVPNTVWQEFIAQATQ